MKLLKDHSSGLKIVTRINNDDIGYPYLKLKIDISGDPAKLIDCVKNIKYKEFVSFRLSPNLLDDISNIIIDHIHFLCSVNYGHMLTDNQFSFRGFNNDFVC